MPRYEKVDSNTVFHPVALRLRTAGHRASLEGNAVAVLSGRDPTAEGAIRRMPGGKLAAQIDSGTFRAHNVRFYSRDALSGGHIVRTKTREAVVLAEDVSVKVEHAFLFEVGDWVTIIGTNVCYTGRINTIGVDGTLGLHASAAGGGSVAQIAGGSPVLQTCKTNGSNAAAGTSSYLSEFPQDLLVGQQVQIAGHRSAAPETVRITAIGDMAEIGGIRVYFTPALASTHHAPVAIVPVIERVAGSEAFIATLPDNTSGATKHALLTLSGGTMKGVLRHLDNDDIARAIRTTIYDTNILAVNGKNRPRRLSVHTLNNNNAPPAGIAATNGISEYVGFPPFNLATTPWSVVAGGQVGVGTHRILCRFVDKSVHPFCYSPPIAESSVTTTAGNQTIRLDMNALMTAVTTSELRYIVHAYRRATHLQVLMSPTGSSSYFLAVEHHLGHHHDVAGWRDWDLQLSDIDLLLRESIPLEDLPKGLMPLGTHVHYQNGITFVAGISAADAVNEYPRITSNTTVYFSRTDMEEPENFPPENYKVLSEVGDRFQGFVKAGDLTVILFRSSFTLAKRLGTILEFDESGGQNMGCAYEDAYCSLGSHAAWVSDESIWLFNGLTEERPVDIGADIRDWVRSLRTARRVRVSYDPVNMLLVVSRLGSGAADDTSAEAMIYRFAESAEERGWTRRENFPADVLFSGEGLESASSPWALYRISGAMRCYRCTDFIDRPIVEASLNPATSVLRGTIAAPMAAITSLELPNLPAAAGGGLIGLCIHFLHASGSESIRVIGNSAWDGATADVEWTTAITLAAGDRWVIGGIPFRLRFPPVRGEDPFAAKTIYAAQAYLDEINYGTQATQDAELTVKLLADYRTSPLAGGSAKIAVLSGAAVESALRACAVEGSGGILEMQVEQIDHHVDFALLYASAATKIPGTMGGDNNPAV